MSRSRCTVAAIFVVHQSRLVLGVVAWIGLMCQKQPSQKMAKRRRVNAMSIVRLVSMIVA